jgi:hypothetical protein
VVKIVQLDRISWNSIGLPLILRRSTPKRNGCLV